MILPTIVDEIVTRIQNVGSEAFVVGGCVRDSLLGSIPHDWDITTSLQPPEILELFSDFKTFSSGLRHGTIGIVTTLGIVEVTTYRIDGKYTDNRHPEEVVFSKDIRDDLKRRDFTINAMAFNRCEGLVDLFGGQEDLDKKFIRTVGDPNVRFSEDSLRILRAVRFASTLGFEIHQGTKDAIVKNCHLLDNISRERIASELSRLILAENPFNILIEYESLFAYLLKIENCYSPEKWRDNVRAVSKSEKNLSLRLALLLDGFDAPEILRTLRFDNKTISEAKTIAKFLHQEIDSDIIFVKKQLSKIGADNFLLVLKAKKALLCESPTKLIEIESIFEKIVYERQCFSINQLAVDGNDLESALNISGKTIGDTLQTLLDAVISEKCENTKDGLLQYARENE